MTDEEAAAFAPLIEWIEALAAAYEALPGDLKDAIARSILERKPNFRHTSPLLMGGLDPRWPGETATDAADSPPTGPKDEHSP